MGTEISTKPRLFMTLSSLGKLYGVKDPGTFRKHLILHGFSYIKDVAGKGKRPRFYREEYIAIREVFGSIKVLDEKWSVK